MISSTDSKQNWCSLNRDSPRLSFSSSSPMEFLTFPSSSSAIHIHHLHHLHLHQTPLITTTFSFSNPLQNRLSITQPFYHSHPRNPSRSSSSVKCMKTTDTHLPILSENQNSVSSHQITPTLQPIPLGNHHHHHHHLFFLRIASSLRHSLKIQLWFALMAVVSTPIPCYASDTTLISSDQVSGKIDIESILISIDDFFNRYPFFVAGVTFIWLVVIPLTEEYFRKYKFILAIDAFKKLRDDPNSELLDIRDKESVLYLPSPNLKIFKKGAVRVHFMEGDEEGFVKKVLEKFSDPQNTTLCILDNFDGKSREVAELLFKNGFKEAYAIKDGLRGKYGWQAIQETLLPPSTHVFPVKSSKKVYQPEKNGDEINKQTTSNGNAPSFTSGATNRSEGLENGSINSTGPTSQANLGANRQSSPYPNYPDMKPPSSPTPSKPGN